MTTSIREPRLVHGELNTLGAVRDLPPAVREPLDRHAPAFFAWRGAQAAADQAHHHIGVAERSDHHATAVALATGKATPRPTAEAARKTAEEAGRQARAAAEAVALIEDALFAAIATHRDELLKALDEAEDRDNAAVRDALADIRRRLEAKASRRHLRRAVDNPHGPRAWTAFDVSIPQELRSHIGERAEAALTALGGEAGAPVPGGWGSFAALLGG